MAADSTPSPGASRSPPAGSAGAGWVAAGAVFAFLGVAIGALGAHALKSRLTADALATYEIGVRYHLVHALALVLVGVLTRQGARLAACGWSFALGIVLFSGSLYALSLTGVRQLGAVTPFGGAAFLAGWLLLAAKFSWRPGGSARE